MADFRILSLDGGGSWALIQVMSLIDLFGGRDTRGHDVLRRFDLIASNSGGSIPQQRHRRERSDHDRGFPA